MKTARRWPRRAWPRKPSPFPRGSLHRSLRRLLDFPGRPRRLPGDGGARRLLPACRIGDMQAERRGPDPGAQSAARGLSKHQCGRTAHARRSRPDRAAAAAQRHRNQRHSLSLQPQPAQRHEADARRHPGSHRRPSLSRRRRIPDPLYPRRLRHHRPHRRPLLHAAWPSKACARSTWRLRPRIAAPAAAPPARWPFRPENGADQFHYTATNFVPGLDIHAGAATSAIGRRAPASPAPS